jgi:hypothetical protein
MNVSSDVLPVDAFNGTSGKSLLYPCAGSDWEQPFQVFAGYVSEFIFVDIGYQFREPAPMGFEGWDICESETRTIGQPFDEMRYIVAGNTRYRDIEPAWLVQTFRQQKTGRTVTVTRRRGFGQYAIDELRDASLGVFFHRGDSSGEGGSNVFYLANRKFGHRPLDRLFDNLKRKFTFPALIASDGSNTQVRQLRRVAMEPESQVSEFSSFGLLWKKVARIPWQRGDTVLWRVTLEESF